MTTMRHLLAALSLALLSTSANAWWNAEWTHRSRITLNTTAAGQPTSEAVQALPLALRMHSGNFDFGPLKIGHYTLGIDGNDFYDVELKDLPLATVSVTLDVTPAKPDCTGGHEFIVKTK